MKNKQKRNNKKNSNHKNKNSLNINLLSANEFKNNFNSDDVDYLMLDIAKLNLNMLFVKRNIKK